MDRIGARPVLWFGLSCFVVSGLLIGSANGYAMLMAAAVVGGIGNSVFHPADYSIINHRVTAPRLGHAFSAHGLTGNLGWALTPVFMTSITLLADWRVAAYCAAGLVALVLLLAVLGRDLIGGPAAAEADAAKTGARPPAAQQGVLATLATLLSKPALWGAFLFFAFTSIALSSVQNYTIPLLGQLYDLSKVAASSALSGYMIASAVGMAAGGFLVSANPRTERTVMVALILAGLTLVVLALGLVPAALAAPVVGLAGFCSGVAAPSRDMLIRRVTPRAPPARSMAWCIRAWTWARPWGRWPSACCWTRACARGRGWARAWLSPSRRCWPSGSRCRRAAPIRWRPRPRGPEARRSRRSVWRIAVGLSAGTMAATLLPAVRPAFLFAFLFVLRRIWRAHLLIPLSPSRACVWSTPRVAGARPACRLDRPQAAPGPSSL